MKKSFVVLLTVIVVGSFASVAIAYGGGKSEAIDWTEAGDYEDQEVTITGVVGGINDLWAEKQVAKVCIVFGELDGDHFNIAISLNPDGTWPEYVAEWEDKLDSLVGKTMEVTGNVSVNSWESCFEISLNDANADRAPDAEAAGTMVIKK